MSQTHRRPGASILLLCAVILTGCVAPEVQRERFRPGWRTTLGGVSLEHGVCFAPDGGNGFAYECEFDASTCRGTCGAELSRFTAIVESHNDRGANRRRHRPGWTLRLRGEIPLALDETWELGADRVAIDCHHANLKVGGPVPVIDLPVRSEAGQRDLAVPRWVAEQVHPGDIVFAASGGWQVPVGVVETNRLRLAWDWRGPSSLPLRVSTGRAVRQTGEGVSFPHLCHVYNAARWGRGERSEPVSVISTDGWDTENGWCTSGFDHPGDYDHANVHRKVTLEDGGIATKTGSNGVRFTGCFQSGAETIARHARMASRGEHVAGAGFLSIANTTKIEPRYLMNFKFRCFVVVGGHKIELDGVCESPVQMLWAPQGVGSLLLTGAMNHQNVAAAPRDLPWIDLGKRTKGTTVANIRLGFIFFQWGKLRRRALIRARGNPVWLHIDGVVKNNDGPIFDLPPGSVVRGDLGCVDFRGMKCPP